MGLRARRPGAPSLPQQRPRREPPPVEPGGAWRVPALPHRQVRGPRVAGAREGGRPAPQPRLPVPGGPLPLAAHPARPGAVLRRLAGRLSTASVRRDPPRLGRDGTAHRGDRRHGARAGRARAGGPRPEERGPRRTAPRGVRGLPPGGSGRPGLGASGAAAGGGGPPGGAGLSGPGPALRGHGTPARLLLSPQRALERPRARAGGAVDPRAAGRRGAAPRPGQPVSTAR